MLGLTEQEKLLQYPFKLLLIADSGEVFIESLNFKNGYKRNKKNNGCRAPGRFALYNDLTALENLMFWGGIYNVQNRIIAKSK